MRKEILNTIKKINKKFGDRAIILGSEARDFNLNSRISTGSISLDIALGGGVPFGRLFTLAGEYSSCKSLLAYNMIANCQKMKKKTTVVGDREIEVISQDGEGESLTAALIQLENNSYTEDWGETIGINNEELIFSTPSGMEEAIDIAVALQKAGVELIVIDSYAALVPLKEMQTDAGDSLQMGLVPKGLGSYHRKFQALNNRLEREGKIPTAVVAINQLREKIGGYGDTTYYTGGRSTGFTNSIDTRVRPGDKIKIGSGTSERIIGKTIKFKIVKNKVGIPFKSGEFDFYNDDGGIVPKGKIDNAKELITEAMNYGIIEQRGAWFYYGGEKLGQGRENVINLIRNSEELFEEIKNALFELVLSNKEVVKNVNEQDEEDSLEMESEEGEINL